MLLLLLLLIAQSYGKKKSNKSEAPTGFKYTKALLSRVIFFKLLFMPAWTLISLTSSDHRFHIIEIQRSFFNSEDRKSTTKIDKRLG